MEVMVYIQQPDEYPGSCRIRILSGEPMDLALGQAITAEIEYDQGDESISINGEKVWKKG